MKKGIVIALLVGCLHGTTTPGVTRCMTVYFPFGFYRECEEGPKWSHGVDPPPLQTIERIGDPAPPPAPKKVWWCAVRDDGLGLCMHSQESCEDFRGPKGPGGASNYRPCVSQVSAFCGADQCFNSETNCHDFEQRMGRDPGACAER
jgi:hypothetical protein